MLPPIVDGLERRASPALATVDVANDRLIKGVAIVFDVLSVDLGGFRERILPQAVNRSLKADVRALVDHDTGKVLGRTTAGTLVLRKEKRGLAVTIEPDQEITYAKDIVRAVSRGDVSGMSFAFWVPPGGAEVFKEDGGIVREIHDMEISEISIVTFPAYLETDVQVAQRSIQAFHAKGSYDWRSKYHDIMGIADGQ